MTIITLYDKCVDRMRIIEQEEQVMQRAREKDAAAVRQAFLDTELDGVALGQIKVSADYAGHDKFSIRVDFPGGERIVSQQGFAVPGADIVQTSFANWDAKRDAKRNPTDKGVFFGAFLDAVIYALCFELDEPPEYVQLVGRGHWIAPPRFNADTNLKITIRCFCGSPVDTSGDYGNPIHCAVCGQGCASIADFLTWKDGQRGKPQAEPPAQPAMYELFNAALVAVANASSDDPRGDILALRKALDRFRCTCGKFPVENDGAVLFLRCCDHVWDDWWDFLAWKDKQ